MQDIAAELAEISSKRSGGARVVFTNGCFDIVHIGHVRYLQQAKALGEILVVGLNSDRSVRALKGDERPFVQQAERREVMLALRMVDYVFIFDEDTPLELIKKVRPDVLVKGGDWPVDKIVGHDFVAAYGGVTLSLPYVSGFSTTSFVERLRSARS